MLRSFLFLAFLMLESPIHGRPFSLAIPSQQWLRDIELEEGNGFAFCREYFYMRDHYKALSEMDSIQHIDFEGSPICSFRQSFENGVGFSVDACNELGVDFVMRFPKTDVEQAKKLIELLCVDCSNEWSRIEFVPEGASEGWSYGPKDEGAGCYYGLFVRKNQTIIEGYCGD